MSTITLYDCPRLRARLTLASCEANRAKRDIMQAQCEWKEPSVRPYPCRSCTDWQAWNSENTVEVIVAKKERFVCAECSTETLHYSRGLCRPCYKRQYDAKKKVQGAEQALGVALDAHVEEAAATAPVSAVQQEAPLKPATCTKTRRIYLACPYTSAESAVMEQRRVAASSAANALLQQGYNVFSPISHGAEVGKNLPPDFAFWGESCLSFVKHWATDVFVLMLPGWETSVGVSAEVEAAKAPNIPVTHILPMPCNHGLPLAV